MADTTTPTIIIDTREKRPYEFSEGIPTIRHKLPSGDYSIKDAEHLFAIERKSLSDWLHTIIHQKARFRREMQALAKYDRAYIVVEGDWQSIMRGDYERADTMLPQVVTGITLGILMTYNVPVIMASDRPCAREIVERLCAQYAKHLERARARMEREDDHATVL